MAASAALQGIIDAKRANPWIPGKPIAVLRAESEAAGRKLPPPDGTTWEAVAADGARGEWILPPGAAEDRTFYFLHGGGYYRGSVPHARGTAGHIGAACRARVFSVEYRLAPEHPFPAAIDDVYAGYRWLLDQGTRPERIVVGGMSAGGGLTLALLMKLKRTGEPMPAGAVPMCAWADLTQSGESYRVNADRDPSISKGYLDHAAAYYLNGADPRDPLASPLFGDPAGLPPLLLQVGAAETLLDDSRRFAAKAEAVGVQVTCEAWDDLVHGFHNNSATLPEAREAIARIGAFFDKQVSSAV